MRVIYQNTDKISISLQITLYHKFTMCEVWKKAMIQKNEEKLADTLCGRQQLYEKDSRQIRTLEKGGNEAQLCMVWQVDTYIPHMDTSY